MELQVHPHTGLAAPPGAQGHAHVCRQWGDRRAAEVRCWHGTLTTVPQNPRSEKRHLQDAFTAHKIHLARERMYVARRGV